MTRIIIDDIRNAADLMAAVETLLNSPLSEQLFSLEEFVVRDEHFAVDQGQLELDFGIDWERLRAPGPAPYVPCPRRGTHARLTECWMCWSDVHRGAAAESQVLADAWDAALDRLVREEGGR